MARRPQPLHPALGDVFSVVDARRAGITPGRLRGTDLRTPFFGVRERTPAPVGATEPDDRSPRARQALEARRRILQAARAYATVMSERSFFSHATAGVIWNLPVPVRLLMDALLDASVTTPSRASRAAGVRGRQIDPELVRVVVQDGMRVASPASTWAQLGALADVDELVALGDAVVHQPRTADGMRTGPEAALATLEQLEAAVAAGRRIGAARLRAALPLIRPGTASPHETTLRLALRRAGLPEPVLDYDVRDATGVLVGCTEFAYPAYGLLIECEGDHHRTDRRQWNRDIEKYGRYVDLGWTVLRFSALHLSPTPSRAVERIRTHLWQRGWRP